MPKAKEKPAAKMEKPKNVLRSETTNWYTASKITIRGDCLCFCIKRKPSFVHLIWQILVWWWLLFFEIWTPAWSSSSTSRFHEGIFFFSWQNGTLSFFGSGFFFSLFFYQGLSSTLVFPRSKIFFKNIGLSCVNFVNCVI